MSCSTSEQRVRLSHGETGLSPPVKYFYWPFQCGASFVDRLYYFCLVFVMLSCASVYWCLVVTCWERADFSAVTFPLVSWVRCGAWLYRSLIFALFLTFKTWTNYIHVRSNILFISKSIYYIWACVQQKVQVDMCAYPRRLITLRWAVHRQDLALKTKTLIRLLWCADWFVIRT